MTRQEHPAIKGLRMIFKDLENRLSGLLEIDSEIRILQRGRSTIIIEGKKPYQKRTEVRCKKGDPYDAETGVAMALLKHAGMTRQKMYQIMASVEREPECCEDMGSCIPRNLIEDMSREWEEES